MTGDTKSMNDHNIVNYNKNNNKFDKNKMLQILTFCVAKLIYW